MATWSKHVKKVTFTVTFSECSEGGLLKFSEATSDTEGYNLKWGRNAYFTFKLPKEAPAEGTPSVEELMKRIAELEAATKPKPRTKPKA